jgi:hypothetical protein
VLEESSDQACFFATGDAKISAPGGEFAWPPKKSPDFHLVHKC